MGQYSSADIKTAVVDESGTSGIVVAAVAGKRLSVLEAVVTVGGATALSWSLLTGPMPLGANGIHYAPFREVGHFQTAAGVALTLVSTNAVAQGGWVRYVEL